MLKEIISCNKLVKGHNDSYCVLAVPVLFCNWESSRVQGNKTPKMKSERA